MKRTLLKISLISLLALTLVACNNAAQSKGVPATAPSQSMSLPADLRDFRYCEVLPVFRDRRTLTVEVYNTMGLNACPPELWAKLDADALSKQSGATATKLNGPRYWVLNQVKAGGATATGKIVDFGGIEMKLLAKIETKLSQGSIGDKLYTPNQVQRTTSFFYRAGNLVYELTSPKGDVYRMQSYAQIVDPNLTIADLEQLGNRLKLPQGWKYQARMLKADSELKADGLAYVVNDDFSNSYQKVMP